jgi:DNA primase
MHNAWVDFKVIKQTVSMEMALAMYGIQIRRISPDYLRGRCPLPTHQSQRSSQSFIVNTGKNAWVCQSNSCIAARAGRVGGNMLDFVACMEACPVREAARKVQDWFGIRRPGPPPQGGFSLCNSGRPEGGLSDTEISAPSACDHNKPLPFTLSGIDILHPYLAQRKITESTARIFGIGFFPGQGSMKGRIVIPIHTKQADLIAYVGRAVDSSVPKYRFPTRFRKSLALFNLHRAASADDDAKVIVVEGFFDCMKVHQAGYQCVLALMGSTLSVRQEKLLEDHFQRVVLMLDGDKAGISAASAIAARLTRKLFVKVIDVPAGRQPDQMSTEEIRVLLMQPIYP